MKKILVAAGVALAVWALVALLGRRVKPGPEYNPDITAEPPGARAFKNEAMREVEAELAGWPEGSRRAAHRMIQKYGVPDEATARKLVWNDSGPWKRTVVYREAGHDVLEQVAAYHIPNDRYEVIGRLEGNVSAERGRDELVSKASDEALNFLALNLADEVITGRRAADEARDHYHRTAALAASGKTSPYIEGLMFVEPAAAPKP